MAQTREAVDIGHDLGVHERVVEAEVADVQRGPGLVV